MHALGTTLLLVVAAVAAVAQGARWKRDDASDISSSISAVDTLDFELVGLVYRGIKSDPRAFQVVDVARQRDRLKGAAGAHWSDKYKIKGISAAVRDGDSQMRIDGQPAIMPNPKDKPTILALAELSYNAYENFNETDDWIPVPGYNTVRV